MAIEMKGFRKFWRFLNEFNDLKGFDACEVLEWLKYGK